MRSKSKFGSVLSTSMNFLGGGGRRRSSNGRVLVVVVSSRIRSGLSSSRCFFFFFRLALTPSRCFDAVAVVVVPASPTLIGSRPSWVTWTGRWPLLMRCWMMSSLDRSPYRCRPVDFNMANYFFLSRILFKKSSVITPPPGVQIQGNSFSAFLGYLNINIRWTTFANFIWTENSLLPLESN